MKKTSWAVIILMVLACAVLAFAQAPKKQAKLETNAEFLPWLSGAWSGDTSWGHMQEWWMPAADSMVGMNRVRRGGKTLTREFMLIEQTDRKIYNMIVKPTSAQMKNFASPPTTFSCLEASSQATADGRTGTVVFVNSEHDFPNKITYTVEPADRLLIKLEGVEKGKQRSVEFLLTKSTLGKPK